MGSGYKLYCTNCDYVIFYTEGIGMMHPHNCKRRLEAMKAGSYGEEFQRYANEIPNPAIKMEKALFRCETCGNLVGDEMLEIGFDVFNIATNHSRY